MNYRLGNYYILSRYEYTIYEEIASLVLLILLFYFSRKKCLDAGREGCFLPSLFTIFVLLFSTSLLYAPSESTLVYFVISSFLLYYISKPSKTDYRLSSILSSKHTVISPQNAKRILSWPLEYQKEYLELILSKSDRGAEEKYEEMLEKYPYLEDIARKSRAESDDFTDSTPPPPC